MATTSQDSVLTPLKSTPPGNLPINEQLGYFRDILSHNHTLIEVLIRASTMDIPEWYLASGCLFQTVWNVTTGQHPETGIADYDLVYFDNSDISWEAEDKVIQAGNQVFVDLPAPVQIRNQARVHLWYEQKHGIPCLQHQSVEAAIATFPSTTACLGVRLLTNGEWRIYTPHGLYDVFNLIVRPNPGLSPPHVYESKAERWKRQWPTLTVFPWPHDMSKYRETKITASSSN